VWDPEPEPWGTWTEVIPAGETPVATALAGQVNIPIRGSGKAEWGDMILIFGGESSEKGPPSDRVQIYNSLTNEWSYGDSMPEGLANFGAAVLPGVGDTYQIITFGGVDSSFERVAKSYIYTSDIPVVEDGCVPDATTLCLNGRRFQIRVSWEDFEGNTGEGFAHGLTGDTGYFWYFDESNVEMVIKVLDGTWLNGHFWIYYGSLSNVQFEVTITDVETGYTKIYRNELGGFASVGDVEGIPEGGEKSARELVRVPAGVMDMTAARLYTELVGTTGPLDMVAKRQGDCTPDATSLCLNNERFRVEVAWEDFEGNTGVGQAVGMTGDTGYFWFFDDANVELVLKVLDGNWLNNHYWVFYGSLSNVWYEITVTDTETGTTKTYENPSGNFASVGDTEAFPGS